MDKQIYNPRYGAGAEIILNLRSNKLRRLNDQYAPVHSGIILPIEEERYWTPTLYTEEGEVVPETGGILLDIGEFLFGDYHNATERFKEASLADSWRLFHEKRLQAETTNKLNYVSEAESKLQEIKDAEHYANLVDTYNALKNESLLAAKDNDTAKLEKINQSLLLCIQEIALFKAKVMVTGKNSDINIDLFFDPNKDENLPGPIQYEVRSGILAENLTWDKREKIGIPALTSWAGNILESGAMALEKIFYPNTYGKNNFTKKAIKQSLPSDRWTDYLFEGYDGDNGPSTQVLRNKILPHKEYWERELENRKISAIESSIKYKNGNWLFDPQKINPKFRYYSEHNDSGLLGGILPDQILYSFSELGSSWSDWENMALMTMSDVAAGYGAKALTSFAVKRNPYINALITLSEYRGLKSAGKLAEASRLERAAAKAKTIIPNAIVEGVEGINTAAKLAATGSSVYFINRMREHETNSEIIDAWSSRVLKNAMEKLSDLSKVLNNTREYLTSIGIPNENMTDIDIIQHAIAYNIPTGDSVFENEKNEARAGLNKVYNENMSLAVKDYVEAIPFLSFLGSFLKSFGNRALKKFEDLTYNAVARGVMDNTIERTAKRVFTNSNLIPKLQSKHVADFLSKRLKQIGWVSTLEGIEEGQQHLLQQRYGRGEYDSYNTPQSQLLGSSVLEDFRLGAESVAAYLGILFGDPDNATPEIRRVMQIGAVSGFLGGGLSFGAASNILPSDGRDNIRNLVALLRTDDVINKLVGDSYGMAQDTAHMNMFYDAMQKHGVTRQRLQQSLEDLKLFKGEGVTDEYIDRDIELLNDVWYYTNNDKFDSTLTNRGIKKDSDLYKTEVVNAARRRTQLREQYRSIKKQIKELDDIKYAILRKMWNSSDGLVESQDPETDVLVELLYKAYQEYKDQRSKQRKNLEKQLSDILKREVYQEWELKKAEQQLQLFDQTEELNWHDYLESTLDKMIAYRSLQNSEKLLSDISSKKDVIDTISRELGLGIDVSRIQPFIEALRNQNELLYKGLEDEDVLLQNLLRKELNNARKKGLPILPLIENIARRIEKKYGILPYLNEVDQILQSLLLSRSYYDVIKPVVDIYNNGQVDPRVAYKLATPISWRSLSKEEQKLFLDSINEERKKEGKKPLTEKGIIFEYSKRLKLDIEKLRTLSEQYTKHLHEHTSQDDSGNVDVDAESMRTEAAQAFMDFEYKKFEDLRRINHREYLRDQSTVLVEEEAKNGDEDARRVLTEHISEEQPKSTLSDESPQPGTSDQSDESLQSRLSSSQDERSDNKVSGQDELNSTQTEGQDDEPHFIDKTEGVSLEDYPQDVDKTEGISLEDYPQSIRSSQEQALRDRLGLDDEFIPDGKQDIDKTEGTGLDDRRDSIYKDSVETSVEEEQALNEIEDTGHSTFDDFLQTRDERTVLSSDLIYSDFLHQTFKYNNTAADNELPTIINKKIIRDKNGNPVRDEEGKIQYEERPVLFKNGATLRSGGQLAKKLLIPGWFEKADKYFMITADESTVQNIENPDNLVVIMVIQDGQDAYCTFLTGLETKINQHGGIMSDGEKEVRVRMLTMYYSSFYTENENGERTEHIVKNERGEIDKDELLLAQSIILKSQYKVNNPEKNFSKVSEDLLWEDAVNWYNRLSREELYKVLFQLRRFLSGNRPVYSDEKINQEIQKLRQVRNLIIDTCLSKDKYGRYIIPANPEEYKDVVPLNPRTSGGKINVNQQDGKYVFRKLTEGGFGMSEDTEELTRQIQTEEVMLGVGLGERSFAFVPGQKAPIAKLDPDSTGNYNAAGYGHSGKIYYITTTVNGDRRAILLFEKKFRDSIDEINPEDVEEAFTTGGKLKDGETPTIAEFIMRLVTNRISDDVFVGIPSRFIPAFKKHLLNIIVNADPSTWVKNNKELKLQHFARKLFFFDESTQDLVIALKNQNGYYRSRDFNINKLYSNEEYRKIVIASIANNLHWNTDRVSMVDMFPAEFLETLRQVFKNDSSLTEYKIAGIDDLTFKKSDLFNDDLSYKKVSLAAWLISSGKLLTSVGDTIFSSPFVYADGAVQGNVAENAAKDLERNIKGQPKEDEKSTGLKNIQSRLNDFNAKRVEGLLYIQDKKAREKYTEGKTVKDFAILDVDTGKSITDKTIDDITNSLKKSVKKYLAFIKKEYGINVEEKDVVYPDDTEYTAVQNGQALFTASMTKSKKVVVSVDSIDDIEQFSLDNIPVSGVFSVVKSDGTLDVDSARTWIQNTLGLDKSLVIVTNGILRAVDGRIVYGVTNVCVDELENVIKGIFLLRKDSGAGIHYHEAFHYVNLLLHTKEERMAIYNMYLKLHPELKGTKNSVIEELLAEEFRQYCEDIDAWNAKQQKRNKLSRWLHKFIHNIISFVKAWKKQDLIKTLYRNIHSGQYKGRLIDQESLDEFIKIYPTGAKHEAYIPGQKKVVKFNSIQDARTFFDVAENVAHSFLDFANVKKVGDIYGIDKSTFEKFFEKLKKDNTRKENPFIQDVIDNPDAFMDTINSLLRRYGIVRQNKTAHGEKLIVDDDNKERLLPSNEIAQLAELYDNYTINKKDNVAFRAKLFLCQVRDSEWVYDENTKLNVLRQKIDPKTGLLRYVSYDNAWLIITKYLNAVDSYDDIIKIVSNLAKTKAFFAQLLKNLESIRGDIELETLIFNTVNKHLTKVSQIELQDPIKKYKKKLRYSDGTEATEDFIPTATIQKTFDQNKKIEILNDNTLKAKKMLPRDWSKDLFASPLISFVNSTYKINSSYARMLLNKLKLIKTTMRMDDLLSVQEKQLISQQVFPELLCLIQQMAIPFDEDVLTEYIMLHIADKSNTSRRLGKTEQIEESSPEEFYDAMKQILLDPLASKKSSANISFFINTVFNSKSTSIVKISKSKMKAIGIEGYSLKKLDELYEGAAGEIEMMAIAYNNIYPSSRELSITGPGGNLIFPVGENNFMSDITRWINKNHNNIIQQLQSTPYARNSNILEVARILTESNRLGRTFEFKLNVFVGMDDQQTKKGADYFGINTLEDTISKMLLMNRSIYGGENKGSDMIILPTMADKKTYYALELVSRTGEQYEMFNMPHDLLISEQLKPEDAGFYGSTEYHGVRRFSDATLDRFVQYFIDELESLKLYYDKENIRNVVKNKQIRKKNFHGKVKNGKMDFSGNGGHFRYFYGLTYPLLYGEVITELNLNQVLEWEYMREKNAGDPVYGEGMWMYRGLYSESYEDYDGFEGVRKRLDDIERYFFLGNDWTVIKDAINDLLFKRIDEQMEKFSLKGPNQIIRTLTYTNTLDSNAVPETHYANRAIPTQLINGYILKFKNAGRWTGENGTGNFYASNSYGNSSNAEDVMLSVVGNFVVQQMISTIEIEKVFAGDPAFYKWKYSKNRERKVIGDRAHDFEVLLEKDTDKIKRLGALLSPGSELRTDFSEDDYKKYPWLRGSKYVNATVSDVKAKSIYINETKNLFGRLMVADIIRQTDPKNLLRINNVYLDDEALEKEWKALTSELRKYIKLSVELQVKPYSDITVSDAQVLIRPHLYRKIRMMLGQWLVIPIKIKYKDFYGDTHETWYSDDEAYNIIESDPEWMTDPEKAAKVSRLQLFPLKMTYFKNDPRELNVENNIAYGLYNKMAIFPAFKFLFRSKTGKQIYNRMNRESDPLDMLTFESAVKVGLNQNIYSPYNEGTEQLDEFNFGLDEKSGCVLDEYDNESWIEEGGLVTEVLDLKGLRMLLNTEAHTDEERAIGTQMFKILFGNIYDEEDYVIDKDGRTPRKGKEIREDIMKCIKALTAIGAHEVKTKFYNEDMSTVNKDAVVKYLNHVIENNNISNTVAEILEEGGTIESLMLRTLFEHSVSSYVNSHVIDIETKGGSAILQSVFGFVSYGSNQVRTMLELEDGMPVLNDGRELCWNEKDGSMEVMLSMNFFKSVVPKKYQRTPEEMRQWLINHDVIKGFKKELNPVWQRLRQKINSDEYTTGPNLSITTEAIFSELGIKTFADIIRNREKILSRLSSLGEKNLMKEVEDLLKTVDLTFDTDIYQDKYIVGELSKPKPFGVGYRIPTQGMSSTFAFVVADVLPEWCGDVVIVPREFTAQTGSDFDVDKLFLATMSYKNGILEEVEGDDILNASKGAIANRLLKNYIDVVTDIKNRANARASIDVVTGIIQDSTLPAIRGKKTMYAESMYELTPFFLSLRKQEFSIGKNGIGPFALNTTNLSLTQYTHISMDFSNLPVKLGKLDAIVGEDGIRISDWLSAMVNAHVDVAKDPYIFDLNVNKATYKFVNLLLRAGKGESTFLFLAQDAIKNYASAYNNSQGLYGNNLLYDNEEEIARSKIIDNEIDKYIGNDNRKRKVKGYIRAAIEKITDENLKKQYIAKYRALVKEEMDFDIVFDKNTAKKYLQNKNSIDYLIYQAACLKVLLKLDPYAQELSDLVTVSRIDTKKFGNTISAQRNFINEYLRFKYGNRDVSWYNTDGKDIDPRERYFSETFLDDKLFTATGLIKDILSTQSIIPSKLFGDMMLTMLIEIFGQSDEIRDSAGNKLNIYDKVYDKDVVLNISVASENIIRHRLLLYYSSDVSKLLFKKSDVVDDNKQQEKDNDYTGPIDFTFGGDTELMIKELKRLWFGDLLSEDIYEQGSIFTNIALIIDLLLNSSIEDRNGKFKPFVNERGVVINELLNYLKALPANSKFSIPRLLLRKTNRNTFSDEKNRLISAFNDLLTSDIKLFRRFARDLAIYAYYSTYNTNTANSFFDLVPKEFRRLYDMSLAEGIHKLDSTAVFATLNQENIDYSVECKHMLDSVCRNFYIDDKIVPLYEYSGKYKGKYVGSGRGEKIRNIPGSKIPAYLLTTEQSKPFIKMSVDGNIILYKRKMYILAEANTGSIYGTVWNVYLPEVKLGVHEGTMHQYELHASSKDGSMFEDNNIPKGWSRQMVANDILKFINDSQKNIDKELSKRKEVRKVEYVNVNYYSTERLDIQETTDKDTHKTIDSNMKSSKNIVVNDKEKYIQDHSDSVIDFSNSNWYDEVDLLVENNQYSAEKDGIAIGMTGSLDLSVSQEDIDKYIEDQVSLYSSTNNILDLKLLKDYRNNLKNQDGLQNNVLYQKYKEEAMKILTYCEQKSLNVSNAYIEDTLFGRALAEVYNKSNLLFIDQVSIVSLKKVNVDLLSIEKPEVLDKDQQNAVSGALKMDKYVDKTSNFIDEPISTGKVTAITKEMLERLKQLKLSQGSIITNESSTKKDDSFNNKC